MDTKEKTMFPVKPALGEKLGFRWVLLGRKVPGTDAVHTPELAVPPRVARTGMDEPSQPFVGTVTLTVALLSKVTIKES